MNTVDILKQLIAFPTISIDPNRGLIDYCDQLLTNIGAKTTIIEDETGKKANLFATLGSTDKPGVLLSGHTDVVPVAGQNWTKEPFELTQVEDKLYGRGTTDMKGFVASALNAAIRASKRDLKTPLHLALSYDEEIGCIGVRSMIEMLRKAPFKPMFCIVGEPTLMAVATGHKGKTAARVQCNGQEAHSALAPTALNAIHLACDMITFIRSLQNDVAANNVHDDDYDIPYTTLHVGKINGGVALNIVPNNTEFLFEIRNLPEESTSKSPIPIHHLEQQKIQMWWILSHHSLAKTRQLKWPLELKEVYSRQSLAFPLSFVGQGQWIKGTSPMNSLRWINSLNVTQ